ncbi:MAG: CarD family transcriptional regulator [Lachnospiraceae bacterium]|nr:CarD family transcriptional regulator [Lachnospiraceae bacterium]
MAYQPGDLVIYGAEGPCTVQAVGDPGISPRTKGRQYYTLKPFYRKNSMLYVPVEIAEDHLRPVLSREEALALIDRFADTEEVDVADERRREQDYRDILYRKGCISCEDLVRITKTIYQRRQDRADSGKRLTEVDQKYFRLAQEKLLEELSVALHLSIEETDKYIYERLELV